MATCMRHVIGGRPQGWNYAAGQIQGWGGVDIGMYECLTRTGPLFEVKASDLEPMPNLAKSWDWSPDGHVLTMHLIEGAKWSDGVPFTADDVMFYWNDNIKDPNVKPLNSGGPDQLRRRHDAGEGRRLHRQVDLQGGLPQAVPLHHGLWRVLPAAGAYPQAACIRSIPRTPTSSTRTPSRRNT